MNYLKAFLSKALVFFLVIGTQQMLIEACASPAAPTLLDKIDGRAKARAALAPPIDEAAAIPPAHKNGKKSKVDPSDAYVRKVPKVEGPKPRVALALSGGGAKAFAQIGVLRVLEQNHIKVDYIIGTSAGAIIGSLYAAGVPIDEIQEIVVNGSLQRALVPSIAIRVIGTTMSKLLGVGRPRYPGLTKGDHLREFLHARLPKDFSEMKIPFAAVATDLKRGNSCILSRGDVTEAVVASSAIPPLVRPVPLGDRLFVDGGLRSNLPTNCARVLGARFVIGVVADAPIEIEAKRKFKNLGAFAGRVTDIMEAEIDKNHIEEADFLIYPEDIIDTPANTKDKAIVLRTIAAGEKATSETMPELQMLLKAVPNL